MNFIYTPSSEVSSVHWSWISLIGPDAKDFLHRLTTINLRTLQLGKGHSGCFLNPQGKIQSYFTLWYYQPNEYAFEFESGPTGRWKTNLLSFVDQYTFADKITLTDATSELECRWIFPEMGLTDDNAALKLLSGETLSPFQTLATENGVRVCYHGNLDFHRPWITAWGKSPALERWQETAFTPPVQNISIEELERWRIQAVRPRVEREILETTLPLEIGLQDSVAENKGCYPGQEVIEKIIALGSPPRRLARLDGTGNPPEPGNLIFNLADSPVEVGQVTSISRSGNDFSVLGLIRKIHAKEGLQVRFSNENSTHGTVAKIAAYLENL